MKSSCHGIGQWVDGQAHANGLEFLWSLVKRGYHSSNHKTRGKRLYRSVREFEGRHNACELDTIDQMRAMVRGMYGTPATCKDLVAV